MKSAIGHVCMAGLGSYLVVPSQVGGFTYK